MAMRNYLPTENELYGSIDYWNSRYSQALEGHENNHEPSRFEWFKSYTDLSDLIERYITPQTSKICMLGCGNSNMSKEMYDSGYQNIFNLDFSSVLIEQMRIQHAETCPKMSWMQGDVRHLPFADSSFDAAIDKGTMDALMCAKGDVWDPPKEVVENCKMEVDEVARILKPGGVFIYITFGQPHFRKKHLERSGIWEIEVIELGDMFHYYCYVMKKFANPIS
ncbi:hypothetical protein PCASD_03664 [Puccinia coronata f. sp. avenae]|uniref:Methyltransferase type 11 domain-containing protein n=1 Tax=Puccinia coronata f. sp. avenae TaxID=200324 RepID=A0A2N5SM32_9BASI|nr:hypothetical protein PCASD_15665 [Puccinia coronata f. sp. avenae]PLW46678.1 hypothetical protein PCASD_03664 [Puccinia coronata f. sp. avenae]